MRAARHDERNALAIIIHYLTVRSCLNEKQEDTGLMTIRYKLIIWASHCSPHAYPHVKPTTTPGNPIRNKIDVNYITEIIKEKSAKKGG